jgi:hypothetical protein
MKQGFINLVINEKQADVITGLMNISDPEKVSEMLKLLKAEEDGLKFFEEYAKAIHGANWCKDPTCEHLKK